MKKKVDREQRQETHMSEFTAVIPPTRFHTSAALKREAMMFDRIAVRNIESMKMRAGLAQNLGIMGTDEKQQLLRDVDWLFEENIAVEIPAELWGTTYPDNEQFIEAFSSFSEQVNALDHTQKKLEEMRQRLEVLQDAEPQPEDSEIDNLRKIILEEISKPVEVAGEYEARLDAIRLREASLADAYPLISSFSSLAKKQATKSEVIKVVINALPLPSGTTSWEQVLEFRSDPDSRARFLDLRNWMSEVAKGELQPIEVEQKLEHLISTYERHLKLHRMKINAGTLQTIVTTSAEVLGDLVSFKWGKAAEALFALKHRHVALMEAELNSPGNEIAYIVKARESFS